jgi:hypothetical protein
MTKTQKIFEAVMRSKGHTDLSKTATGKYTVPSVQVRWAYFNMGWQMCEVAA